MSNTTHPTNLSTLMSRLPLPTEWIQQTHLVQRWGTVRRVWPRALHVDLVQINKSKVIINLILVLFGADKIVCLSLPMVSKRHPPLVRNHAKTWRGHGQHWWKNSGGQLGLVRIYSMQQPIKTHNNSLQNLPFSFSSECARQWPVE